MFRVVEYTFGRMVTNMKASGLTHSSMAMGLIYSQTGILFKGCIAKGDQMVKALTNGEMEPHTQASLKTA
jgi:hypothetical protein